MVRIAGKLNTARYRDKITRPVLPAHIQANGPMVFVQHITRYCSISTGNNIRILGWPACSPDLNQKGHVWDEIKQENRSPAGLARPL